MKSDLGEVGQPFLVTEKLYHELPLRYSAISWKADHHRGMYLPTATNRLLLSQSGYKEQDSVLENGFDQGPFVT